LAARDSKKREESAVDGRALERGVLVLEGLVVVVVWEYGDVFVGCFTSSWLASGFCWLAGCVDDHVT
jgi:hypothetical protein